MPSNYQVLRVDAPSGLREIALTPGQKDLALTEILRQAHLPLNTRCGQHGHCDGCVIDLLAGRVRHVRSGETVAALEGGAAGTGTNGGISLRACEYTIGDSEPVSIRIPPRSALAYEPQVLTDYRINVPFAHHPIWQQLAITVAQLPEKRAIPASVCAYVTQLRQFKTPVVMTPRAQTQLATVAAADPFYVTLEQRPEQWVISSVRDRAIPHPLGAAIDIGTTTVVLLLTDLTTGKVLARAADFNQQIKLGDDVVTRITLCSNDPAVVRQLQHAVTDQTLTPLLRQALAGAGRSGQKIQCMTIAGNTTMQHLVAGVDPKPMGVSPFTPVFTAHRVLDRSIFQDAVPLEAENEGDGGGGAIHLLPSASAYVGADLTAGILASGLIYDEGPSLLVDVGTNGEIILKHGDTLRGCATAAGPAFEGAGLACGMRAGEGAIAYIEMSGLGGEPFGVKTQRIGSKPRPEGLCGSAYIDFLAEARRVGLVNRMGRFDLEAVGLTTQTAQHGNRKVGEVIPWVSHDSPIDRALVLGIGQNARPIVVAESDVAHLLAAKAAVAAGILILLKRAGVTAKEIKRVYLAGGFGTHMRARNAIRCGLLPGFEPAQIMPVGNTSVAGAYLGLLDSSALDEMSVLARRVEIVELNLDPDFEDCYIDQLCLPEVE